MMTAINRAILQGSILCLLINDITQCYKKSKYLVYAL